MAITIALLVQACSKDTKYVLSTGFDKNEVFRIDSKSCYKKEVMVYYVNMYNSYSNLYGKEIWNINRNGKGIDADLKESVYARLVKIKMMNILATSYNVSLDDAEKDLANQAAKEYFASLSDADKKAMANVDEKTLKSMYKEYALAYKIYNYLVADVNPEISDDEARTIIIKAIYFDTTNKILDDGTTVALTEQEKSQKKALADDAFYRLNQGEEFDDLLSEYSDGADISYSYMKGDMDPMLENAAFALAGGQYSQVLTGSDGYYILYCINPFSRDGTEQAKEKILLERRQEVFDSVYESFVKTKDCYNNDKLWKKISYEGNDEVTTSTFFEIYESKFNN